MSSKQPQTADEQKQQDVTPEQPPETTDTLEATAPPENSDTTKQLDMLADLQAKLAEIQAREQENLLRARAEIENIRRRSELDVEKAHKFALEKFVNELLPVLDSLDRALEVADKNNPELAPMLEGIALTQKSMLDVVAKFGVAVVNEVNVPLDPNVHQAIAVLESDDISPNHVLEIMQKGYLLNGRTLRAAMVTVAKAKE